MISNIWMKTEKIINLDWKQNRSTNFSVLAFGILNAEPIPEPGEWDNGAQEGPLRWSKGKEGPHEKAAFFFPQKSSIMQTGMEKDEIKDYEKHKEYKSKQAMLLEPEALKLEVNDFSSIENPIKPCYEGKGYAENSSF